MDLGEGEGLETSKKKEVNLGRKLVEREDDRKSSCGKLRVVLAVLLLVAVCQNTLLKIKTNAKVQKTGISDFRNIFEPLVR